MLESEKEIIKACQGGDKASFGKLYDYYIRPIYSFVYYKTHHKETAEDLTSQTFFKALKNIDTVDPQKPFSPWLYKIAQNTVIDHYRSMRITADIDDVWDLSDGEDILQDIETKTQAGEIKKYLKLLSSMERDIIIMRIWQELTYKEISAVIGKSEDNCKVIFSRAMAKLRKIVPPSLFTLMLLIKLTQ